MSKSDDRELDDLLTRIEWRERAAKRRTLLYSLAPVCVGLAVLIYSYRESELRMSDSLTSKPDSLKHGNHNNLKDRTVISRRRRNSAGLTNRSTSHSTWRGVLTS